MNLTIDAGVLVAGLSQRDLLILQEQIKARLTELSDATRLMDDEIQIVRDGQYIFAIKKVRERLGLGLKDAKELVWAWRRANGDAPRDMNLTW